MNYQEVSIDFEGVEQKHIWITNDDGSMKSFPADETNPEYVAFLQLLEATEPEADKVQ